MLLPGPQNAGLNQAEVNPYGSPPSIDGGYNWGTRSFPPPVVATQSPVPQPTQPTLAMMRQAMTRVHMQQMLNRLQAHAKYHGSR